MNSRTGAGSSRADSAPRSTTPPELIEPGKVAQLDRQFVVGPTAAEQLDYRIAWQFGQAGRGIKHLSVQDDSVFTLDGRNYLTRIRTADGRLVWRVQCADPVDEVSGVTLADGRVYITSGSSLMVLDGNTGAQIGRQVLRKIANTAPVVYGQFMIYGSRDGQLVWHAYDIGQYWRSYQAAPSIDVRPVLFENTVTAVGPDGLVIVLSASSASQYWSRRLLDGIVAAPAVSEDAVYVAGLDQHLRAFDVSTGRKLWSVLTASPLRDGPVLLGDRLYQQVPGSGLACYEALPPDSPGGKLIWQSPGITGSVIMSRRGNLLVWDGKGGLLSAVEERRGALARQVQLPQVARMITTGPDGAELIAASADGRVERLVPRN